MENHGGRAQSPVILDDSQRWFARNTWRIKVGDGGGEICSDQISATHSGGDLVVVEGDGKGIRDFNGKIFRCNNSNKVRINNRHGSNKLEVWKTQWGKVQKGVSKGSLRNKLNSIAQCNQGKGARTEEGKGDSRTAKRDSSTSSKSKSESPWNVSESKACLS